MPEHQLKGKRIFLLNKSPKKRYCPRCRREIKYTIPSADVTYIVHGTNDLCVIENQIVGPNG